MLLVYNVYNVIKYKGGKNELAMTRFFFSSCHNVSKDCVLQSGEQVLRRQKNNPISVYINLLPHNFFKKLNIKTIADNTLLCGSNFRICRGNCRKHFGKRKKMLVTSIFSPFPKTFSNSYFFLPKGVQSRNCMVKGPQSCTCINNGRISKIKKTFLKFRCKCIILLFYRQNSLIFNCVFSRKHNYQAKEKKEEIHRTSL